MASEIITIGGEELSDHILFCNGLFKITLLCGSLVVLSIPNEFVPKCAWWLVREYCMNRPKHASFSSLLLDDDGLSLVCDPYSFSLIKFLIRPEEFTLCDNFWRAIVIEVTGSADEVPGAVYTLANALSSQGLSILHISTFEAEVFLIQEPDLSLACKILKEFEEEQQANSLLEAACRGPHPRPSMRPSSAQIDISVEELDTLDESEVKLDMSWITPQDKALPAGMSSNTFPNLSDFKLCVLPQALVLARLDDDKHWEEFSRLLTKLLLYNERFIPLEKICQDKEEQHSEPPSPLASIPPLTIPPHPSPSSHPPQFMWGIWQQGSELTVLMEEDDLEGLPDSLISKSPQRWRGIKLWGRPIAFNETGVVSAMSRVDFNLPSLNISTAITNCTLVPEEGLEDTLSRLSEVLGCTVMPALI